MMRALLLLAILTFPVPQLRADEPQTIPPERVVGSVLGKPITAGDISLKTAIDVSLKFDARNRAAWDEMGKIVNVFGGPILERFIAEQKIAATPEEIRKFNSTMRKLAIRRRKQDEAQLAETEAELKKEGVDAAAREKLEKQHEQLKRAFAMPLNDGESSDEVAAMFIQAWKIERALHAKYGGRVIFQQAGIEALDGRRRLFEEAERQGDLKFDDPGVRHLFYYYANMRHLDADAKDLEQPWFFRDPDHDHEKPLD
ncbi:MAG TPA: hypothetical protein VG713_00445 [Pirellulales bacterium]|nr:hypothetical protein [Pirellulales bacterium]